MLSSIIGEIISLGPPVGEPLCPHLIRTKFTIIKSKKNYLSELKKIKKCAKYANSLGIEVHAGHGMDYKTTQILSKIKEIKEFNIGHFIIGEAISIGLKNVIKRIKNSIKK